MNESNQAGTQLVDAESKYAHVKTNRSALAVRGAGWSFLNSIVPTLLNSAVFVVSSRFLTPQDFGVVALVASFVSFMAAFAPVALGEALIQYKNLNKSHLDTVFWLCIFSAVVLFILYLLISPIVAEKIKHPELIVFLPILGLKLFFDLSATVPNALIARAMSFHLIAARTIIATVISSVICISLILLGYGIWALVISQLTVSIASCIAAMFGAKWMPGFEIKMSSLRELYRYGLFASGNRLINTMNLDQIIIGSYIGTAPLGIFNFSRRLFQMLNDVIAGALTSVSHALLSSLQSEKEKVREAFLIATFGSAIVSFPAFVGLAAIAGEAIPFVFGNHWADAIVPTRWFCFIGLMSCIGVIQSSLINSQGKSNWWFYYMLCKQVFLVLTIIVLHSQSIDVIVMAIALQTAFFWPITLIMVTKIIDLKLSNYFHQFLAPLLASVLMLLSILIFNFAFPELSPLIKLIAEIFLGFITYTVSILFLCRERVMSLLKSIRNRKSNH